MAIVPYVMPGFALAKTAADIVDENPEAEGLLLLKHGHFTWGDDAKSSYDRVIEHTQLVEDWFAERRDGEAYQVKLPRADAIAQLYAIKTAFNYVTTQKYRGVIFDWDDDPKIVASMDHHIAAGVTNRGVATPDHVIRIKAKPLVLTRAIFAEGEVAIIKAMQDFVADYSQYFDTWSKKAATPKTMLDPLPKIIWAEGMGLIGIGTSKKEAKMITDLGAQNVRVIRDAEGTGGFYPVTDQDLFDMEYWSLEQAKLGKASPLPLAGQVALVTGAAGTIGAAIVEAFAAAGAEVVAIDINGDTLQAKATAFPHGVLTKVIDITNVDQIDALLQDLTLTLGGVDILISNAGTAPQSALLDMDEAMLRRSFEINFFAHFNLATRVARQIKAQSGKGQLLFNISKQAVNPGKILVLMACLRQH